MFEPHEIYRKPHLRHFEVASFYQHRFHVADGRTGREYARVATGHHGITSPYIYMVGNLCKQCRPVAHAIPTHRAEVASSR